MITRRPEPGPVSSGIAPIPVLRLSALLFVLLFVAAAIPGTASALRAQASPAVEAGSEGAGSSPEHVVEAFFDAVGSLDFPDVAGALHPETLDLYRYYALSVMDGDPSGDFALTVFGTTDGAEVRSRPPDRIFADLIEAINENTPGLIAVMATNAYEFLGHVPEGDSLAHVVARVTPFTNGTAPTRLTTVTVKRAGRGWRVLTSPELDALTTAMRGLTLRSEERGTTGPLATGRSRRSIRAGRVDRTGPV